MENEKSETSAASPLQKIVIADCPFCKAKAVPYFEDKKIDHWMRHATNCWLTINYIDEAAQRFQTFTEINQVEQWNEGRL